MSRKSHLIGKLLDFSLTPEEWAEYQTLRNSGPHAADLHPAAWNQALASFEGFYEQAHIRDLALAKNLIAGMKSRNVSAAVLVAGGFHAEGIREALRREEVTVISFVPKVGKIETPQGAAHLSLFAQDKQPLETLFEGQRLFLAQDPLAGIAEAPFLIAGHQAWKTRDESRVNEFLGKLALPGSPNRVEAQAEIQKDRVDVAVTLHKPGQDPRTVLIPIRINANGELAVVEQTAFHPRGWQKLAKPYSRLLESLPFARRFVHYLESPLLRSSRLVDETYRLWFLGLHTGHRTWSDIVKRYVGIELMAQAVLEAAQAPVRGFGRGNPIRTIFPLDIRSGAAFHRLFNSAFPEARLEIGYVGRGHKASEPPAMHVKRNPLHNVLAAWQKPPLKIIAVAGLSGFLFSQAGQQYLPWAGPAGVLCGTLYAAWIYGRQRAVLNRLNRISVQAVTLEGLKKSDATLIADLLTDAPLPARRMAQSTAWMLTQNGRFLPGIISPTLSAVRSNDPELIESALRTLQAMADWEFGPLEFSGIVPDILDLYSRPGVRAAFDNLLLTLATKEAYRMSLANYLPDLIRHLVAGDDDLRPRARRILETLLGPSIVQQAWPSPDAGGDADVRNAQDITARALEHIVFSLAPEEERRAALRILQHLIPESNYRRLEVTAFKEDARPEPTLDAAAADPSAGGIYNSLFMPILLAAQSQNNPSWHRPILLMVLGIVSISSLAIYLLVRRHQSQSAGHDPLSSGTRTFVRIFRPAPPLQPELGALQHVAEKLEREARTLEKTVQDRLRGELAQGQISIPDLGRIAARAETEDPIRPFITSLLIQALRGHDLSSRADAAAALGRLNWTPQTPEEAALYHIARQDRKAIIRSGATAVPLLLDALEAESLDGATVVMFFYALSRIVQSQDISVRRVNALVIPALLELSHSQIPKVRPMALNHLGRVGIYAGRRGTRQIRQALRAALEDEDAQVRYHAIEGMRHLRDTRFLKDLSDVAERDSSTNLRQRARIAIRAISEQGRFLNERAPRYPDEQEPPQSPSNGALVPAVTKATEGFYLKLAHVIGVRRAFLLHRRIFQPHMEEMTGWAWRKAPWLSLFVPTGHAAAPLLAGYASTHLLHLGLAEAGLIFSAVLIASRQLFDSRHPDHSAYYAWLTNLGVAALLPAIALTASFSAVGIGLAFLAADAIHIAVDAKNVGMSRHEEEAYTLAYMMSVAAEKRGLSPEATARLVNRGLRGSRLSLGLERFGDASKLGRGLLASVADTLQRDEHYAHVLRQAAEAFGVDTMRGLPQALLDAARAGRPEAALSAVERPASGPMDDEPFSINLLHGELVDGEQLPAFVDFIRNWHWDVGREQPKGVSVVVTDDQALADKVMELSGGFVRPIVDGELFRREHGAHAVSLSALERTALFQDLLRQRQVSNPVLFAPEGLRLTDIHEGGALSGAVVVQLNRVLSGVTLTLPLDAFRHIHIITRALDSSA
ncbi:MAG: HEAT repeat domain-containing protein [Elusimicrobiota bacterium]